MAVANREWDVGLPGRAGAAVSPHRVWNATPHPGRRRLGVFASFLFFGFLFPIIEVYACPDTRPLWLTRPPRCWNCGTFLSCGETTWRSTGSHCGLNRASTFAFWAPMAVANPR